LFDAHFSARVSFDKRCSFSVLQQLEPGLQLRHSRPALVQVQLPRVEQVEPGEHEQHGSSPACSVLCRFDCPRPREWSDDSWKVHQSPSNLPRAHRRGAANTFAGPTHQESSSTGNKNRRYSQTLHERRMMQ